MLDMAPTGMETETKPLTYTTSPQTNTSTRRGSVYRSMCCVISLCLYWQRLTCAPSVCDVNSGNILWPWAKKCEGKVRGETGRVKCSIISSGCSLWGNHMWNQASQKQHRTSFTKDQATQAELGHHILQVAETRKHTFLAGIQVDNWKYMYNLTYHKAASRNSLEIISILQRGWMRECKCSSDFLWSLSCQASGKNSGECPNEPMWKHSRKSSGGFMVSKFMMFLSCDMPKLQKTKR